MSNSATSACGRLIDVIDVERVDFVLVPTRDLVRARRFYSEVLGLPGSPSNPNEFETVAAGGRGGAVLA